MNNRDEMIRKHVNNALTETELIDLLESEREKSERYKQALEFYANKDNYFREPNPFEDDGVDPSAVTLDGGKIARQE